MVFHYSIPKRTKTRAEIIRTPLKTRYLASAATAIYDSTHLGTGDY